MHKQRIAFVGCGGIAEHYLSVYRDLEWVEVIVCVDPNRERADRAAAFLSGRESRKTTPLVTGDFAAALGAGVQTVIINTPNHLHREQAVAALDAGKHVLLQKPIAATVRDAEKIAAAAERAARQGIKCGLYLSYFDQPLMHDLRTMVRDGWFGDVVHLYARLMHRGGLDLSAQAQAGQGNWRNSIAQTGGGCFIQLAVHFIHLFSWLTDSRVARVTALSKNLQCPGVEGEDLACAILELECGALATLDFAWCATGEQLGLRGTRGAVDYIGNRTLLLDSGAGPFTGHTVSWGGSGVAEGPGAPGEARNLQSSTVLAPALGDVSNPFNQHRVFLEAVRDNGEPFVSIASGVDDLRVVEAVYESARTGRAFSFAPQ